MSDTTARLPDFLLIGAAKSGTSTLHQYLRRHSGIFLPKLKEPEFFSDDSMYARGVDWYGSLFEQAAANQLCGEASTTYTRWPHTADAAARIAKLLPRAKLIYIMRHPVDRAYSHYAHHMRLGVTMTFEEALAKDSIYMDCSLYMMQIERYLRYFPRESFLFLFFSDMQRDIDSVLRQAESFLDLAHEDLPGKGLIHANPGGSDHFIRYHTTRRLRCLPGLPAVIDLIPQPIRKRMYARFRASPLGQRLDRCYRLQPMRSETRRDLLAYFGKPNLDLATFLKCDLAKWQQ